MNFSDPVHPSQADAEALFDQAVRAYEHGERQTAATLAERVLRREPRHAGALYLLGSVALDEGRAQAALAPLETAARFAPRHPGILRALGMAHFALEHWPQAAAAFRQALQAGPADAGMLNNLGLALKELGEVEAAIAAYRQALEFAPQDAAIYNNLAIALNRAHDYLGALEAYRRSTECDSGNAGVWANLATLCEQANRLEQAEQAIQRGLALEPDQENLHLIAAKIERRRGALDKAAARLESNLARPRLNESVRRAMEFELGQVYDRLGDSERAYAHFAAGNRLTFTLWPELRAGAQVYLAELNAMRAWHEPLAPVPAPEGTEAGQALAFLVGFPRSGTTLMDTLLGAHPRAAVLEEEPFLEEQVVAELRKPPGGYPRALTTLDSARLQELSNRYLAAVQQHLGESRSDLSLMVDKNPFYSTHAALIHQLFPQARFVFALRHPCDVVLSCFMQPFGRNPVLANFCDLATAAETYRRVMDLWLRDRERLPLRVHELRYEALVENPRREMRALLDFLGLEWSDAIGDHVSHARRRGRIYTPSYHQVVQPVYRHAVGRWQRYRKYFGPALETLRPYVEKFGYSL